MPIIGSNIIRQDIIVSTSDEAKKIAAASQEGTVIIATEQTGGRGKHGSSWFSPRDLGLYLSVIVKPRKNPDDLGQLTIFCARSIIETIFEVCKVQAAIKAPNDIMLKGKKIGGVLAEKTGDAVIVGIGINLNNTEFPEKLTDKTTSIKIATCKEIDKGHFTNVLLKHLDQEYAKFLKAG